MPEATREVATTPAPAAPLDAAPAVPLPPWEGRVRARLRAATAARHRALERQLDVLGRGLDAASYPRLLAMLYGFHAPLEARLRRAAALAPHLGVPPPRRAHLLARDLAALGMPAAVVRALPRCPSLPRLERAEHVAGCLYVVEGSALGGRLIAREVERRLGHDAAGGASFPCRRRRPAALAAARRGARRAGHRRRRRRRDGRRGARDLRVAVALGTAPRGAACPLSARRPISTTATASSRCCRT